MALSARDKSVSLRSHIILIDTVGSVPFANPHHSRSVAEMDELFEKRIPAWRTSQYVTDVETHLKAFLEAERRQISG